MRLILYLLASLFRRRLHQCRLFPHGFPAALRAIAADITACSASTSAVPERYRSPTASDVVLAFRP